MNTALTNSLADHSETGKTDETAQVTNQEFLDTAFQDIYPEFRPAVVSFLGKPSPASNWKGGIWDRENSRLSPAANNYYTLAAFKPDNSGQYKRAKEQFAALAVIFLDDVGTKVNPEKILLPPSFKIETSLGNDQWGYLMSTPIRDGATADKIVNAVIAAGLCDPGAGGPTARLARLPEGVNGKSDPAFSCRMREWHPERRFTVEEIIDGLKLQEFMADKRSTAEQTKRPDGSEPILIPCPAENAVLAALKERKLYKTPLGEGKHDITCPWYAEHTGAVDGGTAYFEPDRDYPVGGFHCFHGHCQDRHVRELLQYLGIEVASALMKPTIRVVQGEMPRILDAAEQVLAQSGRYYQRGGLIVAVGTDPGTKETSVKPLSKSNLTFAMASVITWERYNPKSQTMSRCDPPERHCMVLADAAEYRHLPVLNGLARQPYLRPDGSLVQAAGYDAATGMFGVFDPTEFSIADQPTREEAESALQLLKNLLEEFSFKNDTDEAAALSAFLTAAIRPSLPSAPMFHVRAPQISSGKSFLCEIMTGFATPQRSAPLTFPKDEVECEKVLLAALLPAPAVVTFDNLTGDLVSHKSLCAALTSECMTGRILGVSKTATVSTRTLFLSSGNNVGPVKDMTRRCIVINLDPACEIPAARVFKNPNLLSNLRRNRGQYVSAALTIIRAWIVAGQPKQECKSLASYGEWSDLCRQPLMWLEQSDPTTSLFETMMEDPERETLGRLLEAWQENFGTAPKMIRQVLTPTDISVNTVELHDVIQDIAGERDNKINRNRLGWWLKQHAGQIVNGRRLVRGGGNGSAGAWKVESV